MKQLIINQIFVIIFPTLMVCKYYFSAPFFLLIDFIFFIPIILILFQKNENRAISIFKYILNLFLFPICFLILVIPSMYLTSMHGYDLIYLMFGLGVFAYFITLGIMLGIHFFFKRLNANKVESTRSISSPKQWLILSSLGFVIFVSALFLFSECQIVYLANFILFLLVIMLMFAIQFKNNTLIYILVFLLISTYIYSLFIFFQKQSFLTEHEEYQQEEVEKMSSLSPLEWEKEIKTITSLKNYTCDEVYEGSQTDVYYLSPDSQMLFMQFVLKTIETYPPSHFNENPHLYLLDKTRDSEIMCFDFNFFRSIGTKRTGLEVIYANMKTHSGKKFQRLYIIDKVHRGYQYDDPDTITKIIKDIQNFIVQNGKKQ